MAPRKRITEKQLFGFAASLEKLAEIKGANFPDDNARKKAQRKAKAIVSHADFCTTYLPHYFQDPPAEFHRILYEIASTVRLAAVEAARGHAKTTVLTFAGSLRQLVISATVQAWNAGRLETEDPLLFAAIRDELIAAGRTPNEQLLHDPFIVIDFCTLPQAEDVTASIKLEMEQNPYILGDWGELITDAGVNYSDFVTKADDRLLAMGFDVSRRGVKHRQWRPTWWICDDPDSEATISSEKTRKRQLRHITSVIRPAMDPKRGRVFVIANETHIECVVATIYRDQFKPERERKFKSWSKYRFNAIRDDGSILWEARFSREFLEELRAEDEEAFETEYMNNPPSAEESPFKVLQYYKRDDYTEKLPKVGGLDPALGKTKGSDFQALGFVRYSPRDRKILVHRFEFHRLPPHDLVATVNAAYSEEEPDAFVVEAIGFQLLLVVMMIDAGTASGLFPAYETIESQTETKDVRIVSLAGPIRRGDILFPDDGSCRELERMILRFPNGKKDGPDLLEMLLRKVRQIAQGIASMEIRHDRRETRFRAHGGW